MRIQYSTQENDRYNASTPTPRGLSPEAMSRGKGSTEGGNGRRENIKGRNRKKGKKGREERGNKGKGKQGKKGKTRKKNERKGIMGGKENKRGRGNKVWGQNQRGNKVKKGGKRGGGMKYFPHNIPEWWDLMLTSEMPAAKAYRRIENTANVPHTDQVKLIGLVEWYKPKHCTTLAIKLWHVWSDFGGGNLWLWKELDVPITRATSVAHPAEKFHYLVTSLEFEPLRLVTVLPLTEDNYALAWATLTDRYQDISIIATAHWEKKVQFSATASNSSHKLRQLLDTVNENLEH
ncbi:hypothetical protein PR048_015334 [Dryococelus australis]|uniref:Uncharacterized protein n=1 Tax=Dryococelus australis TaxID=614101 RepID=A0ABQ9HGT7_9NEOP|nr:hypothetical protein PR048_015334 [Dryococelus australis]